MTEYKEHSGGIRHRSLYIGLLYNLVIGVILAVVAWLIIMLCSYYVIGVHYVSPEMKADRRDGYLADLQTYVNERNIDLENSDEIGGWIRDNPFVYLLIYTGEDGSSYSPDEAMTSSSKARLSELAGSRIDDSLNREELIAAATANGYYQISLADGTVVACIAEYTENLYYSTFGLISFLVAILTFVLVLVRYIRVVIERIKRFESDVTIVSEIDMGYEIISEGQDEIATLSGKVETMRRTMLDNIKSEQEAREANTELITSISHDIRTPLTILMGYIEMMKEHGGSDEVMQSYISATESTAVRLKNLSDDMFKYSLAFGDTKKSVKLEEYDFLTLNDQLFAEHFLLMRERGYDIRVELTGEEIPEGATVRTDPPNLIRIIDNVFSNLAKYADTDYPIEFTLHYDGAYITFMCRNKIRTNTEGAESNGIGLKSCVRLAPLVAERFEYEKSGDYFISRLVMKLKRPDVVELTPDL